MGRALKVVRRGALVHDCLVHALFTTPTRERTVMAGLLILLSMVRRTCVKLTR